MTGVRRIVAVLLLVGGWLLLSGTSLPRDTGRVTRWLADAAAWPLAHPAVTVAVVAVFGAAVSLPTLLMGRGCGRQDPRRAVSAADRKAAFDRAGNRCEYESWLGLRCRRPAHHADHFFPWSKGGSSTPKNLAAACSVHNLSKSAHMPTPGTKRRLERRRRRYFPAGVDVTAGEWFGR